jgi:hypothetical protein
MNDRELQNRMAELKAAIEADPHCLSLIGDWIQLCHSHGLPGSAEMAEYQLEYLVASDFGKIASPRTDKLQDTLKRYSSLINTKFTLDIPLTRLTLAKKVTPSKIEFKLDIKLGESSSLIREFINEYTKLFSESDNNGTAQ